MQRHFDYLPIWGVFLAVLFISLVALEVGFRRGRTIQKRAEQDQEKEAPVGAMVGAMLDLRSTLEASERASHRGTVGAVPLPNER